MTKKEKFYGTALRLIHEKGFKAMTIRDLASALSCDSANIYNYVESKAQLLENLLFDISNRFHEGADRILESQLTPTQQIEEVIRLHVQLSSEYPFRVGLLVNEWRNLKGDKLNRFVGERQSYESKVRKIISRGVKEGVFRNFNIEVVTFSLLGSLRWQHDYYLNAKGKSNPLNNLEELKKAIIPGLLAPA